MGNLGETRGSKSNGEKVIDGARELVGPWGKGRFRLGSTDVVVSSHSVRRIRLGRTRVDVVNTRPSSDTEALTRSTHSATVTESPFFEALLITESNGTQAQRRSGRLRGIRDASWHTPDDVSDELTASVNALVVKAKSERSFAQRRLDSHGRTPQERSAGKDCNALASQLLTDAIHQGHAEPIRNHVYDTAFITGGVASVPAYEATFPYGDQGEITMIHGPSDLLGRMEYDITVRLDSDPRHSVNYLVKRNGKVVLKGPSGETKSASPAQTRELYLTLYELHQIN